MTTNEALTKYNFISKVMLKSKNGELSRGLKVKVMSMRIELGKVRKEFDADVNEFRDNLVPEEFKVLASKQNRTPEEETSFNEQNIKLTEELQTYINERYNKEVPINSCTLTDEEFIEIVETFDADEVDINGQKLPIADYLDILHSLFVE